MEEGNDDNADGSDGEAEEDDGHRDMEGYRDETDELLSHNAHPHRRVDEYENSQIHMSSDTISSYRSGKAFCS